MFENCMYEQLNRLQEELKACVVNVLVDNGYDNEKAKKSVEYIKNFNVYETETGFRVDTLVDDYKISVFHHKYETRSVTMYKELSDDDKPISERFQKLENWLSSLQSLVDTVADSLNDDVKERVQNLEKHIKCVESDVKLINGKLKFIGDNLTGR